MRAMACALTLVFVASSAGSAVQDRPLPDPERFLREVRGRLQTNELRQSGYTYVETRHELKLDKQGKSTRETVKVLESYPGLPGEYRWERLIAENGTPVPARELEKRDRERQRKAEAYVRRLAREPDKVKREQARQRETYFREMKAVVDDIFTVYDIRMLGREPIEGHETIAFALTPRRDARPRTRDGGIMKKFAARAWVSESDYELARVDVEAIDTVSIGLGFLARVHKGTRASFTRRKVNDEVWLPVRTSYTASARIGLVKVLRVGGASEFSNYRKFSVDTTTTYTAKQ
jgi:hypothetical protein